MKLQLKNVSRGWFSVALHTGVRLELKPNQIAFTEVDKDTRNYYNQFIPLGISIREIEEAEKSNVDTEVVNIEEVDTFQEATEKAQESIEDVELVQNHIDEYIEEEVRFQDEKVIVKEDNSHVDLESLENLSKQELRDMLTNLGIKWAKNDRKQDLIKRFK